MSKGLWEFNRHYPGRLRTRILKSKPSRNQIGSFILKTITVGSCKKRTNSQIAYLKKATGME